MRRRRRKRPKRLSSPSPIRLLVGTIRRQSRIVVLDRSPSPHRFIAFARPQNETSRSRLLGTRSSARIRRRQQIPRRRIIRTNSGLPLVGRQDRRRDEIFFSGGNVSNFAQFRTVAGRSLSRRRLHGVALGRRQRLRRQLHLSR